MFIIKSGSHYVVQSPSGFSFTTDSAKATEWKKEKSAINVVKTCLLGYSNLIIIDTDTSEPIIDEISTETEMVVECNCNKLLCDTMAALNNTVTAINNLKKYSTLLKDNLKQSDLLTQDILHAIEFYNYSAADGYKMYKKLHETRLERRANKDLLQLIQMVESSIDTAKIVQHISNHNSRTYAARVDASLFEKEY